MPRLRATLVFLLIALNTVVHAVPLLAMALLKVALPFDPVRRRFNPLLAGIAESWIAVNTAMLDRFNRTRVHVALEATLRPDGHYLVLANHQSWVDIVVLQKVFNRRIPLLRFFLKRQLFWVPVLGLAWWALDFPFMARHTREQVARRPELAGRDIAATRRACAKFRSMPVAVMNFVEGTRFTPAKHAAQQSPYRHLLKPRAGGMAFVIDAMGDGLHAILDVAIAYPAGRPTMLDLLADRLPDVRVHVRERPVPRTLLRGGDPTDPEVRAGFQQWINALWQEKDARLERMSPDA